MATPNMTTSIGLLVLRVGFGALMMVHGVEKLLGYSDLVSKFPDPIGLGGQVSLIAAIGAELVCSVLLIVGFGTRLATLPLIFTMLVALFVVHGSHEWSVKEKSALYLAAYVPLIITGPGVFSLDYLLSGRKKK